MSDQNNQQDDQKHIVGKGVWMDLPDEIARLVYAASDKFFQDQKGNDVDTIEQNAARYVKAFQSPDEGATDEWEKVRQKLQDLIDDGIYVMRISAIYDELKPFIDVELQKPEYSGITLHEMIEGYHNAEFGGGHLERMYQRAMYNAQLAWRIDKLMPYIEKELKQPQYEGKTIDELRSESIHEDIDVFTNWEIIPGSLFDQLFSAASIAAKIAADKENTEHITVAPTSLIEYPLDKISSYMWNLLEQDTGGQISFDMSKDGKRDDVTALYAIDFDAVDFDSLGDDIKISKQLLPSDRRVYQAINALFNAGNNVITLTQIHYMMGNTTRPNDRQLRKINEAITKMNGAHIYVNNSAEAKVYKNYPRFIYDGSLLPLERAAYIVNGQLAEAAIHIFREPPLITFAKQRKQITTVNVTLLQSPVNKTDANILIDDYLIERISHGKNGKGHHCRILFKTLYERTNITEKKQKQRAPAKIARYLKHYQQNGFIKRFTVENDGITVYW